jgi:mevalonate kinase
MIQNYHSNGNLLLTGEYLISQGAEAIALPLKKGHTLAVTPIHGKKIIWESVYNQETKTKTILKSDDFEITQTNNENSAKFIQQVLRKAMNHLPPLSHLPGYHIKAIHDYPEFLEFGCESALIANIANWFNINPYRFIRDISPGLEHGIACARSNKPILYQLTNKYPDYREINLNLPFKENIYIVYTGHNPDSSDKKKQTQKYPDYHEVFPKIKEINKRIIQSNTYEEFENSIRDHDKLLSEVLNEKRLQERIFQDFPGIIKPLNEWSGEFILVTWKEEKNGLQEYFDPYNIQTIFSWDELVK